MQTPVVLTKIIPTQNAVLHRAVTLFKSSYQHASIFTKIAYFSGINPFYLCQLPNRKHLLGIATADLEQASSVAS